MYGLFIDWYKNSLYEIPEIPIVIEIFARFPQLGEVLLILAYDPKIVTPVAAAANVKVFSTDTI